MSSLFGSFAPKASTQPTNNASLPAGGGLFGATTSSQSAPNNASLFNSGLLLNENPQTHLPIDAGATLPQPAYFDALLQRGKKRQTDEHATPFGELPQLQLGLQDISRKVRNLGQGSPSAGLVRGLDTRAHYLLSASGVNTGAALRDLDDLSGATLKRTYSEADQQGRLEATGVHEVLAQKYSSDFRKMVDAHIQRANDDFDKMIDEKLHGADWNAHRQRIYEHFGLKKPQELDESTTGGRAAVGFGRPSRRSKLGASKLDKSYGLQDVKKSVIGSLGVHDLRRSAFGDVAEKLPTDGMRSAPEDRALRTKQEQYGNRVKDLNVARLQEKAYPVLHRFCEVESEPSNDDTSMLVHAYKALVLIVDEKTNQESISDPGIVKERQYAPGYVEDIHNALPAVGIRKRIINGSRTFLEGYFYAQMETTVARNPREANIGGLPTPLARAKGYVRVRASRKELGGDVELLQELNGDYCWPVLFYLLRSGLGQEALEYVEDNAAAFRQIDRSFVRYLRAYVSNDDYRLPSDMQTAINNEYSQRCRLAPEDSIDPYRMVCYKIIGRCEIQKRSLEGITTDMMDWLWLQFALAREYNRIDEFAHEAFGLEELRQSFKEIGERYFGPHSDVANAPTTLFLIQILAGLFEKAVADLYPHNYVSAVHFAIALDFYGLLRVSDISNSDDLLSQTTRNQSQLAFGSMLGLYTRDFRLANATLAVDYICLICLDGDLTGELGHRQRELCHQALIEVVLETREFAQLLGDIRSDGQRIKGAIEQRLSLIGLENEQDFLKHITLVAARTADEQTRVTDAALLFHLAEDYDKVIQVVNEAVSLSLTTELGEQPARLTPLKPRAQGPEGDRQLQSSSQTSLSLTAVNDPIQLARNMVDLYSANQMYYSRIKEQRRDSCVILLELSDARKALEARDWPLTIDRVNSARILPTEAQGNMAAIRATATSFNQLPSVVARTVGYVMLWTVIACSHNVDRLRNAEFETGAQQEAIARCVQTSKDVMVFAGLIRFKLPGRVWEALARVGGEVGAY